MPSSHGVYCPIRCQFWYQFPFGCCAIPGGYVDRHLFAARHPNEVLPDCHEDTYTPPITPAETVRAPAEAPKKSEPSSPHRTTEPTTAADIQRPPSPTLPDATADAANADADRQKKTGTPTFSPQTGIEPPIPADAQLPPRSAAPVVADTQPCHAQPSSVPPDTEILPQIRLGESDQPIAERPSPAPIEEKTRGKGGKQHRYLQSLVKELAEQQGLKATIEAALPSAGTSRYSHRARRHTGRH